MQSSKYRILVVEDLQVAQKAAKSALRSIDCEIDFASTGQEAINLFNQNQYDLVFMDVGLPDMHGLTVVEQIRDREEGQEHKTPIIALSVHTSDEYQEAAIDYGMNDFLSKPITAKKAKKIIDKYLK